MALFCVLPIQAQSNFDRLDLHVAGSLPLTLSGSEDWRQVWAAQVTARTPYFEGFLETGFHGQGWSPEPGASGMNGQPLPWWVSIYAFVGAHVEGRMGPRTDIAGGLRLGNYFMVFDTDAVAGQRRESEFAMAPVVRLQFRIWRDWRMVAEAMWIRTFTMNRMDAVQASIGVSHPLDMPEWFGRVLE
jgi:hypothetical protein